MNKLNIINLNKQHFSGDLLCPTNRIIVTCQNYTAPVSYEELTYKQLSKFKFSQHVQSKVTNNTTFSSLLTIAFLKMSTKEKDLTLNFEAVCRAAQKGNVDYFRGISQHFREEWLVRKCNQRSGDNILHIAARFGRLSILEFIAKELFASHGMKWSVKKLEIFDSINADRKTPLHEAAQSDHLDCVQFLLQQKVNVDSMKRADW